MESVERLMVGPGVIGLAVARALARVGREVIVVESENTIRARVSSRNSEVIQAAAISRSAPQPHRRVEATPSSGSCSLSRPVALV